VAQAVVVDFVEVIVIVAAVVVAITGHREITGIATVINSTINF
jgi:hypothetical protein